MPNPDVVEVRCSKKESTIDFTFLWRENPMGSYLADIISVKGIINGTVLSSFLTLHDLKFEDNVLVNDDPIESKYIKSEVARELWELLDTLRLT